MRIYWLTTFAAALLQTAVAQHIGEFTSVVPSAQTPILVLPSTHTFQVLAQEGMPLSAGGTLRAAPDFTGFVPINGSSERGHLSLNHELNGTGGFTIFDLRFNRDTELWQVTHSEAADIQPIYNTARNCSGGITPWGTVLSGEETYAWGDGDGDGYQDLGWLAEVDPVTRRAVRKIWAAGRAPHENAAIAADGSVLYTGADDPVMGFLYKYIPRQAGDLSDGDLYVLRLTANGAGDWLRVPNATQADRNATSDLALQLGASNIQGIEDVEFGRDGYIYLAAKYSGQVYRFRDDGATVSGYETFVATRNYPIDCGGEMHSEPWGLGNDNLAFDAQGNLWVLQDGGRDHIWMVHADHRPERPHISLFATTPAGCEPTGITFTPDGRFMFLSLQHPSIGNAQLVPDAEGKNIAFNRGTTLVIARREQLGSPQTPVRFRQFSAIKDNFGVKLYWQTESETAIRHYAVQRSDDSENFATLALLPAENGSADAHFYQFVDAQPRQGAMAFYRILGEHQSGTLATSRTVSILWQPDIEPFTLYPNPAQRFAYVDFNVDVAGQDVRFELLDMLGRLVETQRYPSLERGSYQLALPVSPVARGAYWVRITQGDQVWMRRLEVVE